MVDLLWFAQKNPFDQRKVDNGSVADSVIPPRPTPRSLEVLLVDDDELIQSSAGGLLGGLGHKVTIAACGEAALKCLEDGLQPDVVILDVNMPGLGGAGTLPLIRASHPALPILVTTGRVDQVALDLVKSAPFVSLLPKPFDIKELREHLNNLTKV